MTTAYLFGGGVGPDTATSGTLVLPANGGTVAIPFVVSGVLRPVSITCRTTDTSGSHTLELGLFADDGELGVPVGQMLMFASFTFTATVAAVRTGVFTDPPVPITSGTIWVVCRNAGAATTTLSTVAAGGLGGNVGGTQTLASTINGSIPSTGWAATASLPLVRINGLVSIIGGTLN